MAKFGSTNTTADIPSSTATVKFGNVLTTDDMPTPAAGTRGIVATWTNAVPETQTGVNWQMQLGVSLSAARLYLVSLRAAAMAAADWEPAFTDGTTIFKMGPLIRGDNSFAYQLFCSCLFVPSATGFYTLNFWTSTVVTLSQSRQFWVEDVTP